MRGQTCTSRIQARQDLERQLAQSGEEAARLEREAENLEGQVEQLTIALMDATSKRTDSELRLRQFQQVRMTDFVLVKSEGISSFISCPEGVSSPAVVEMSAHWVTSIYLPCPAHP